MPLGSKNASWTNNGFKYLTLDNVMADAVSFIDMLKHTHSGTADSKVVVASGTSKYLSPA